MFQENYLGVPQAEDVDPVHYPYVFVAPSNTGIPSGFDLDNDGSIGGPNDAYGFGFFPGQYGMVGYRLVHVLASHPTPPVFDGEEDRNGTRNHDEIRFWADYIDRRKSWYIYDDHGRRGGIFGDLFSSFVIMGDMNADPFDGDATDDPISQLRDNRRINTSLTPESDGAFEQAALQGEANESHLGDPAFDTADFADVPGPGNLRVDYVLPSWNLRTRGSGVFWPTKDDPQFDLVGVFRFPKRRSHFRFASWKIAREAMFQGPRKAPVDRRGAYLAARSTPQVGAADQTRPRSTQIAIR